MTSAQSPFPVTGDTAQMLRAGTTVRVEARVAEGGQGVVCRGVTSSGARVAVKWFLQQLFARAFTTGLKDASLSGRITEGEWRRGLARLADCVSMCSCTAAVFWDPENPGLRCWNCGQISAPPPVLRIGDRKLALAEGTALTSDHLARDNDYLTVRGLVERHPRQPGALVLRNLSDSRWTVRPDGEEVKSVGPGRRLGVRPMAIEFGKVRGSIVVPSAAP